MEHNIVSLLPGLKTDRGHGRVVRETSLLCAVKFTSKAFSGYPGPPSRSKPHNLNPPFDEDELRSLCHVKRSCYKLLISPLMSKGGCATVLLNLLFKHKEKSCQSEAKPFLVESLIPKHQ